MRTAVFMNAGLGNALLLTPLVKALKNKGATVSAIVTSPYGCEELFTACDLYDEVITLKKKTDWIKIGSTKLKRFDQVYLDWFSSTRKNLVLAATIGKEVITNNIPEKLPKALAQSITFVEPAKDIHEGTQNLRLLDSHAKDKDLSEDDFQLSCDSLDTRFVANIDLQRIHHLIDAPFVAVQISAANNVVQYKNWPPGHWKTFLRLASQEYPSLPFLLLGDKHETGIASAITDGIEGEVYSLVGKTKVKDAMAVIEQSTVFTGVDGGLMHIASALNKPTFTLWGASDFHLYGYEKIAPEKHRIIYQDVDCRPCNSWISPNTSRVDDPASCPDIKCMKELTPERVFNSFKEFITPILSVDA